MKLLAAFLRLLYGKPMSIVVEDLHARFIGDWLAKPSPDFVHPKCTWTLGEGHPVTGSYAGADFYGWYKSQFVVSHGNWQQVISNVIGSPIGAIVVGKFHFQEQENAIGYTAPFAHFYRIRQGKIIHVQCCLGMLAKSICSFSELGDMFPASTFPSLN